MGGWLWLIAAALMAAQRGLAMGADPMLTLMTDDQLRAAAARHPGAPALVFTEARERPIRRVHGVPAHWQAQTEAAGPAFVGEARPGEFFVFQIGVFALADVGPLALRFGELRGDQDAIPARALRCLSLGGVDHRGARFAKRIEVKRGDLQALWVGLAVPAGAHGRYSGRARLQLAAGAASTVAITVEVRGEALADSGDSAAKNLSRLRWLDSTVGSEPTLTHPFTPVRRRGRVIGVLGREMTLGDDGLPAQIVSRFSAANTRIEGSGREVLAAPARFVAETAAGPVAWRPSFGRMSGTGLEATWTAGASADGLRMETRGRLDYTGSGEVCVRLIAERDVELRDARLEMPWREAAARYFMGLNHPGGLRPEAVRWKWDVRKRQDCLWMGELNAGLMLRFKDAAYLRPPVNIYYSFRPLRLPDSWGNGGLGGVDVAPAAGGSVTVSAYGGPRRLRRGEALDFVFELYLTPFRTLETDRQWATRFAHVGGPGRAAVDAAVAGADAKRGPTVVNVHHASHYSPYINYPYSDDSFPAFQELVRRAHDRGVGLRVYYTTREITQNMPELFPLHAFNGEIILPGPGREARTLLHPNGPHAWLTENLREGFIPAWEAQVGPPYADLDLSVITTPDSRWSNFYLEGLRWLVEKSDFDGMYIDDTALDATSLRRARRIIDSRPGRIIDLHTWNHFNDWAGWANNLTIYMEILPFLDRLWLGEGFDASAVSPDFWLVEMSGLPFGVMSEMLDGANPWRGMIFGETARHLYSGDCRALWEAWDAFGMQGAEFMPWCMGACPASTDQPGVLATVYRRAGRSLIALASWAPAETQAHLKLDWAALGLDASRARLRAPAIAGFQPARTFAPGEPLPVSPARGWLLVAEEAGGR